MEVINAGVSGDTTSAGPARLDRSIAEGTDAVIVELGTNDVWRALPPSVLRAQPYKKLCSVSGVMTSTFCSAVRGRRERLMIFITARSAQCLQNWRRRMA